MLATPLRRASTCWSATCSASRCGSLIGVDGLPRRDGACSARSTRRWRCSRCRPRCCTGLAFAAPIAAFAATRRTTTGFATLFRFVDHADVPVLRARSSRSTQLPPVLEQLVAYVTPLWHGVDAVPRRSRSAPRRVGGRGSTSRTCASGRGRGFGSRPGLSSGGWRRDRGETVTPSLRRAGPPLPLAGGRGRGSSSATCWSTGASWLMIVSGFFEPLFYLLSIGVGIGALVGDRRRSGRPADRLHGVRRPGAARVVGDERRDLRLDVQRLLQAEVRQDVRRGARHAARRRRRRGRRDHLGADARRALRGRRSWS